MSCIALNSIFDGFKNETYTFVVDDFLYSDNTDEELSKIRIDTLPAAGTLNLDGIPVIATDEIDLEDIPDLTFDPVSEAWGIPYTTFTFSVYTDEYCASPATMTSYIMTDPISDIKKEIESIISGITRPTYQVDWGTVGERIENRQTAYPAAIVEYAGEDNTSFDGTGAESLAEINQVKFKITIYDRLPKESKYPIEDIERKLLTDLVVLKKVFFKNNTVNSKCDHIKYENNQPVRTTRNDKLQASTLEVYFLVQYQQEQNEPATRR